ncbi:pilus assembly PilX N-terminal domain-containing protein [Candidatus Poribacteria bacterium]|nr:pilus assembly PilX N-terminal domain-containing protein [Candidatus Poribacteria bacterium]
MYRLNRLENISVHAKQRCARLVKDDRGSSILFVLALITVMILLGGAITNTTILESRNAFRNLHRVQALYLAEAGIAKAFSEFENGATDLSALLADDGILSFGANVPLGNGTYSVIVKDNDDGDADMYNDSDRIIEVTSTGSIAGSLGTERTVVAHLQVFEPPNPVDVQGAVTTLGPIGTLGTLVVDGRDHDLDGFLVNNNGVVGIITAVPTFVQSGASKVGGTVAGIDYRPKGSSQVNPAVIETNVVVNFNTPDQVLDYPEGALKSIAQGRVSGSQYVTDPADLTFPLSGVTYVELPSGTPWEAVHFGNSSGILVVHNTTTDAVITNLATGTFTGLVIADDPIHIQNTILGAVIALTPTPSEGNCIGNGTGDVLYSSEAIEEITQVVIGVAVVQKSWSY